MLSRREFIRLSLEINLFFQRIMKEHLFFIETNLQPVEPNYITEANTLKQSFEELLAQTVFYANGVVSKDAVRANEFVTPYTLRAEKLNSKLTGASIDTEITQAELELAGDEDNYYCRLEKIVCDLNSRSLNLLQEVIDFQNELIDRVQECEIFIGLYPEMLIHDILEAEYYQELLNALQARRMPRRLQCSELNFWNHIMAEHAQFIDGMLDPTERDLKETAASFAEIFERLVNKCIESAERQIARKSLENTEDLRDFKRTATQGLLDCEIKSVIPPLLADHVLREANHYLRLLRSMPCQQD